MASTAPPPRIGDRRSYDGALCTVRFSGSVDGTSGTWLGVEWDDPTRGKHDGSHKGTRYFECQSKSPTAASFIRPSRPSEPAHTFISALYDKYASEVTIDTSDASGSVVVAKPSPREIHFFGKVAEEVGFDKIRRRLARVQDLRIVILDGYRVASARAEGEPSVSETCPRLVELDLSRNLLVSWEGVVSVCRELSSLTSLRLSGNRFQGVRSDDALKDCSDAFGRVKELSLAETLMDWEEICYASSRFPALATLHCGTNQLHSLGSASLSSLAPTLTTLNLEFNEFKSLSDVAVLASLPSLRNLHLKGNYISTITSDPSAPAPIFPASINYLDISYNDIATWSFVDSLREIFPGVTALRLAHNPIYDKSDPTNVKQANQSSGEEAHMIAVGRLANLKTLNFISITPADRANAEMFYLSRIAKELAAVDESEEGRVLQHHPRYAELCELYGDPDIIRQQAVNPEFLEARLVAVDFRFVPPNQHKSPEPTQLEKTRHIPKSFDIYAVKRIAAQLFNAPPRRLRLIWETGEWDPVAGFDDEEGDSDEEDDAEEEVERAVGLLAGGESYQVAGRRAGQWVRREVELRDGPRQLGFCVDGLEVRIRVEMR